MRIIFIIVRQRLGPIPLFVVKNLISVYPFIASGMQGCVGYLKSTTLELVYNNHKRCDADPLNRSDDTPTPTVSHANPQGTASATATSTGVVQQQLQLQPDVFVLYQRSSLSLLPCE